MKEVKIGNVTVGNGNPAAFMAELGTFYNNDIDKALKLIEACAEAEVDIIKTEILHDPAIVLNHPDITVSYNHATGSNTEKYHDLIARKTVSLENYQIIVDAISQHNIPLVASVYDFEGVNFLEKNNAAGIKIWRNNYNNFSLIRHAAQTKLPLIFDFAFTSPSDMLRATETALENGASGVVVNYHPGKNPCAASEHDLGLIATYKKFFNAPVGLSCHYAGDELMYAAIGAGMNIVEKGVFDNISEADQNVISATDVAQLKATVAAFRNCSKAMGGGSFQEVHPNALEYGFVASGRITKGDLLSWENLRLAFPNKGISCSQEHLVIGSVAAVEIEKGRSISFSDIRIG